ncbi:hypothetical protein [Schlesneria sp. T3-172]|uniref:hypothetical protein n=1 Tax=Schlesneria sphaerica TaxID=3373610 RepID=UPI0037C95B5E
MGEFFKSWRRKIGVMMLAVACVFAVGWVRSQARFDAVNLQVLNATFFIQSREGGVLLMRSGPTPFFQLFRFHSAELKQAKAVMKWDQWYGYRLDYQHRFGGFEVATGTGAARSEIRFAALTLSYWFIVIPMTLISACLLLWKPKTVKSSLGTQNYLLSQVHPLSTAH